MTDDRLSHADLARYSACAPEQIARYCELGLIRPSPDDARFDKADVSRVRLLVALGASGITADQLAAADRAGGMTVDFAGDVVADQAGVTGQTYREALQKIGLDTTFADRVSLAIGLPAPRLDDLVREDDRELLGLVAEVRTAGINDDALLRILRVYAVNLSNIVAAQRDLFRQEVEDPRLAQGMSHRELTATTTPTRVGLQRIAYRATFLIQRRLLEQVVFENMIARFEENLRELGIAAEGAGAERSMVFLDMSDFTRMTEQFGDNQAADHSTHFLEIVQDSGVQYGARLVKLLGDGVMLHFRDAANAVRYALRIVGRAEHAGLPPVRAGIATGTVISRDGDYFGHTVNLAARLVAAASPGSVLVDGAARAAADAPDLAFEPAGDAMFKGIDEVVPVYIAHEGG